MADTVRGDDEPNPYEAPKSMDVSEGRGSPGSLLFDDDTPEVMRQTYLAREATARTIGLICYLRAGLALFNLGIALAAPGRIAAMAARAGAQAISPDTLRMTMVASGLFGFAVSLILGLQLRRLRNWARWAVIVFDALGLFGLVQTLFLTRAEIYTPSSAVVVLSMVISIAILALLLPSDNAVVFSLRYREAIAATPEIRPVMGMRDKALLAACLASGLLGIAAQLLS